MNVNDLLLAMWSVHGGRRGQNKIHGAPYGRHLVRVDGLEGIGTAESPVENIGKVVFDHWEVEASCCNFWFAYLTSTF